MGWSGNRNRAVTDEMRLIRPFFFSDCCDPGIKFLALRGGIAV
jgi:hypothetical protein